MCDKQRFCVGTVNAGKLADITVIDRNILANPDDLLNLQIEMTIVDAKSFSNVD
jgi:predicted amidohydrolase YtcJ